ncbi:MAG: RHS repeat-associated core domain-containing protein, partial [Proteobacteria bacterium]
SGKLVGELNGSDQLLARYVYATQGHSPDVMITKNATYKLVKDQLGSIRSVINAADGVFLQAHEYDEFGKVLSNTNPGAQPFGYAGGIFDADTGLVRFGARDYDAETGRWTSKDPILFGGGDANLYGYVAGEPINRTDPSGLKYMTQTASYRRGLKRRRFFKNWIRVLPLSMFETEAGRMQ